MTLPILGKEKVEEIIPHKKAMTLINAVYSLEDTCLTAGAILDTDSPFFNGKSTPGYVAFELIAQSISAYSYLKGFQKNGKPCIGFILKVSDFTIQKPFLEKNAEVRITVKVDCQVGEELYSFNGRVTEKEEIVAEGRLLVMCASNFEGEMEKLNE